MVSGNNERRGVARWWARFPAVAAAGLLVACAGASMEQEAERLRGAFPVGLPAAEVRARMQADTALTAWGEYQEDRTFRAFIRRSGVMSEKLVQVVVHLDEEGTVELTEVNFTSKPF